MSTAELRNRLKQKIDSVNDDRLLKKLLSMLEEDAIATEEFKIPEEHKSSIDKGINQIKTGATKSHNKVQMNVKKWLYK